MNEEERIIRSIKYIINQNYVDTEDDIIGILIKALNLIEKQDNIINEYETECRQIIAFCRKIRKDYKHDVDNFNQGQEYKCAQFLSLLDGEKNWTYEGKYFDEHDRQIEELNKVGE